MRSPLYLVGSLAVSLVVLPLCAQESDGPPVDVRQILSALQQMRDQKEQQVKAARSEIFQKASSAAASPQAAAAAWEEAVRAVQFQGMAREGTQFREWRDNEGAGLKEQEGQNAARLYFQWLTLTLQRANGATVTQLLPSIIQYTRDLMADQSSMSVLETRMAEDKEKISDLNAARRKSSLIDRAKDAEKGRRMHNMILKGGLLGSVPVQAYKAAEFLKVQNWEENPGNVDGIYSKIILPELRRTADARVLEYWDIKLKFESDAANAQRLEFETEKFNQVRRPELLWLRAKDEFAIGRRNRAVLNMFNLVRSYPTHPAAATWIGDLEKHLGELLPKPQK